MCGLFGCLSSTLTRSEIENAIFLGILSSTRGIDSTGIALFGRGKKDSIRTKTHRLLGNSVSFFSDSDTKKVMSFEQPYLFMGHTRWAPLGAVNIHNSHPIEEGPIVLCHNGSIDNFLKDKKDERDSDSRELARRLGKQSLLSTLKSVGSGHYAITFVDYRKKLFTIVRNNYRPLCYMYDANDTTMYWASESWMLQALKLKEGSSKFGEVLWFRPEVSYEFPLGSVNRKSTVLDLNTVVEHKPPAPHKSIIKDNRETGRATKLWYCHFCKLESADCQGMIPETSGTGVTKSTTLLLPKPASVPEIKKLGEYRSVLYKGWGDTKLLISAVAPRLRQGCVCCATPQTPSSKVFWFHPNEFVCGDCKETNEVWKKNVTPAHKVYEGSLVRMH